MTASEKAFNYKWVIQWLLLNFIILTNNYVILKERFYSDITQEPKWKNSWLTNKEKTEPSYWRGKERSIYAPQNINRRRSWTFGISRSKTSIVARLYLGVDNSSFTHLCLTIEKVWSTAGGSSKTTLSVNETTTANVRYGWVPYLTARPGHQRFISPFLILSQAKSSFFTQWTWKSNQFD